MPGTKASDRLPRLTVRFPGELKSWLREEARRNGSSEASEVIRSVRDRMDRQRVTQKTEG